METTSDPAGRWLRWYGSRGDRAAVRLYVFGFAGGGASAYRSWGSLFEPAIEVCAVQLPGREDRIGEPLATDFEELAGRVFDALVPTADLPFAFFGHSLGALFAYDMSRRLHETYGISPRHLFVSAHRPPHLPDTWPPLDTVDDAGLLELLRDADGTPDAVLQEADLVDLFLPILKADLALSESYEHVPGRPPLPTPITAVGGDADPGVGRADLEAWAGYTEGPFAARTMPGGHFFPRTAAAELVALISARLTAGIGV
ncbi:thioesterase II family protein [Actinomadura sp. 1N219]|uniref:thioesterase II family protein n=1 Tax=Actinomadura sp. 1N219 TaxID=3375152 RepID=UPI0037A4B405